MGIGGHGKNTPMVHYRYIVQQLCQINPSNPPVDPTTCRPGRNTHLHPKPAKRTVRARFLVIENQVSYTTGKHLIFDEVRSLSVVNRIWHEPTIWNIEAMAAEADSPVRKIKRLQSETSDE